MMIMVVVMGGMKLQVMERLPCVVLGPPHAVSTYSAQKSYYFTYKGTKAYSHVPAGGGTEVIVVPPWLLVWASGSISKQLLCRFLLPNSTMYSKTHNESPLLEASSILIF